MVSLFFKFYAVALVIFFAFDLLWLGVIAKDLYKEQIGFLLAPQFRFGAALLFYLLYVAGLVLFTILPAFKEGNWLLALLYGAFFGLVAYATYDLTNLATIKNWPVKIVVYDLLWGSFISGATALLAFWMGSYWKSFFK